MNHVQAREAALEYIVNMMGWKESRVLGCLQDPIVPDTFLVAVEIIHSEQGKMQFAILISHGEVADDGFLMEDFFHNGGVLDEADKPKKRKRP